MLPIAALADGPMAGTVGNNLTAFNGNMGALNNNNWNAISNPGKPLPNADFGNCNALILRCAQPKCASGGCLDMAITYPIVNGCVMANPSCKGYGDDLTSYISAQLVANSTAKSNANAAAANASAAAAGAEQSSEQLKQMQNQMEQMQNQMAASNAESAAAVNAALEEQKRLMAQAAAAQAAATVVAEPSAVVAAAVNNGVSADVLARDQISGQILTQLENAQVALKSLKKTMQTTFDYAGCDSNGNDCTGPKRVKTFKNKSGEFFEPYETVLDEVYDALIMAQSLGVDITDIYMMLNGSCNVWGKYFCAPNQNLRYAVCATDSNGNFNNSSASCGCGGQGNPPCPKDAAQNGKIAPIAEGGCQLIQMLNNNEEVQQNWLYPEDGTANGGGRVEVGCASEALDNSALFRGRKKQASIDIETLQRIISQDAPAIVGKDKDFKEVLKFCAISSVDDLEKAVGLKTLPKNVCVTSKSLDNRDISPISLSVSPSNSITPRSASFDTSSDQSKCNNSGGTWNGSSCVCNTGYTFDGGTRICETLLTSPQINSFKTNMNTSNNALCISFGGTIKLNGKCDCSTAKLEKQIECGNLNN